MIPDYINRLKAAGYADQTLIGYARNLVRFERFLSVKAVTDLKQVTPDLITDYHNQVMARPIKAVSKAMALGPVRRLFQHLVECNRLLINPAEHLPPLARSHRLPGVVLTIAEMRRLLAQPDIRRPAGLRDRAIMQVLYATGIRCNELLQLETIDANLKERILSIRHGKGAVERMVPLGKAGVKHLSRYLQTGRPVLVRSRRPSGKAPDRHRMFLNIKGLPLTAINLRANVRKYRLAAGIQKRVSPHTFRRTFATHLLQQGADIRYIQKLLGHKRLTTTQVYTRVMPMEVKQMHSKIKSEIRISTSVTKKDGTP